MATTAGFGITYGAPGSTGIAEDQPTPQNVSSLFEAINTGVTSDAQAASEAILGTGDIAEANAYASAEGIANANARLATVGGQVAQAQEGLQITKTLGSQKAAVAASGFQESGSALSLLKSSTQQGLIQQQVIGVNAAEQAGGYLSQAAASAAEAGAATAAGNAATSLSQSEAAVGAASKTSAINEAAAMGLNIPGLANLSATNIPTANPVTVGNQTSVNPENGLPYQPGQYRPPTTTTTPTPAPAPTSTATPGVAATPAGYLAGI